MSDRVHYIPVGFDFERLIYPISKGELEADRVILITHEGEVEDEAARRAGELASDMTEKLHSSFDLIGLDVEEWPIEIETLYAYENVYPGAFRAMRNELREGNEVFVNISSMPRTVAFAFATAADSLIAENPDDIDHIRDRVHTYYVPPDEYLVLEMIDVLRAQREFLEDLDSDIPSRDDRYDDVVEVVERIDESGVTEGVADEDQMYIQLPATPGSDLQDFEKELLDFLYDKGVFQSISRLAKSFAKEQGEEFTDSFRSRVQYNLGKLEGKGYVERERAGNRLETGLSTMGRMWVDTH